MTTAPATVRDTLAFVRECKRGNDERKLTDRFLDGYLALFIGFYLVAAAAWLLDTDLTTQPFSFLDTVAWLPLLLFGVVWGILHFATWQGPVLFSDPELQWILGSPLDRHELVGLRLRRAAIIAAGAGGVGGAVAAVVAAAMTDEPIVSVFAVAVAAFASLSLLATALSWHVERRVRWTLLMSRATPVVVVVGVLIGVAVGTGHDTIALWSGPWGWATGPIIAAAGGAVPGWPVQALLLLVAVVAAVLWSRSAAADFAEEELWRRAEARSAATAALFFGDIRTIRGIARRERTRGRFRGRDARIVRTRWPMLAIPGRDVLLLRRSPGRVILGAMFVGAGFTAAVAATHWPILGVFAFLGFYLAGSRMVEPVRVEVDTPDTHRLLPWPWGILLILHCVTPVAVLTCLAWVGLGVVTIGGWLTAPAAVALALVTPFGAAAIVTPAAISAARRPFPVENLVSGNESGPFMLILFLVAGPALAAIAANIGFGMLRGTLDQGVTGATFSAIFFLATATGLFVTWLGTRKAPE